MVSLAFSLLVLLCVVSGSAAELRSDEVSAYTHDQTCELFTDQASKDACKQDSKKARDSLTSFLETMASKNNNGQLPSFKASKSFSESKEEKELFDYNHKFCEDVVDSKASAECKKVGETGVSFFSNLMENEQSRKQVHNLTEELLQRPESESWVGRELLKLYTGACDKLDNAEQKKACVDGAKDSAPKLIYNMIKGDLFQKIRKDYTNPKTSHRRKRWLGYLPVFVGATAIGMAVLGGAIYGTVELIKHVAG